MTSEASSPKQTHMDNQGATAKHLFTLFKETCTFLVNIDTYDFIIYWKHSTVNASGLHTSEVLQKNGNNTLVIKKALISY